MSRVKERTKILHHPSTHELFVCLSDMPQWSKLLLEQEPAKPYADFLKWLLQINFYKEREERVSIKSLAATFKSDSPKVTKWIHDIYDDIFDLNYQQPHLFQKKGIQVKLYLKEYDNNCTFNLALPVLPRQYEIFKFYFVKGKIGNESFWVKKVEYLVENDKTGIEIWLEGGSLNKYRELALDKALFLRMLSPMDIYQKLYFQIDDELKDLPIHK